jgi:hypothetical protein
MAEGRVTTVELGTNRFIDCRAILAYQATDVVAVELAPLRVTLCVPAEGGGPALPIEHGQVVQGNTVTTLRDERSFSVFVGDSLVLAALLRSADTVHLKLDLRPLGLVIFDDADGLHIGTNVFAQNRIAGADVAIALG